ncbi:alpha/beta hydrolase [Nocardia brasiliensis]|uniref:alpha/beta hydrolase n=1 Tax=Nocardia brasiliensis TaxID=37326 RepID=UPI00366AE4A3
MRGTTPTAAQGLGRAAAHARGDSARFHCRFTTKDHPRIRTGIGLLVVTAMLSVAPGLAHPAPEPVKCTATAFDFPGGRMGATLCVPGPATDAVMLLIPGASINQNYWDSTYQPQTHNFRRAMNAAGYATLTVDRLGTGTSSRPPGTAVTSIGQAAGIHQIVGELRRGLSDAQPFSKIILGGVSLGAGIAILEATTYHDVDAVFLSGYSHHINVLGALSAAITFVPAAIDPRFAGRGYNLAYLTTAPGTRAASFLPAETPPQTREIAEQSADVFTITELLDGLPTAVTALTNQINVPVLLTNGSADKLCAPQVCANTDALHAAEAPYFAHGILTAFVLPDAGRALNLASNTGDYHAAVSNWFTTATS